MTNDSKKCKGHIDMVRKNFVSNLLKAFLAMLTLHIAFFGIVWIQYEFACSRQSQSINMIIASLSDNNYKDISRQIANITTNKVPKRPHILDFKNIYREIFALPDNKKNWIYDDHSKKQIRDIILSRNDWSGASFTCINLSNMSITGADFSNTILASANFEGSDIDGCNFSASDLKGASFKGARFLGTRFIDSYLVEVDFSRALLLGVNFSGSIFAKNNFELAHLDFVTIKNFYAAKPHRMNIQQPLRFHRWEIGGTNNNEIFEEHLQQQEIFLSFSQIKENKDIALLSFVDGSNFLEDVVDEFVAIISKASEIRDLRAPEFVRNKLSALFPNVIPEMRRQKN